MFSPLERFSMDYQNIGFKAGLEIHQQLETHKLFCCCQSKITENIHYSFERLLRPTQSELGDVDKAALTEAKKHRRFLYTASNNSTCLVEADEEPPHLPNSEAVDIGLTMCALLQAKPVDEIQFMRKIVIDGSNTSGFQRTALIAVNGLLQNVRIQTIALEEDAARKLTEKGKLVNYGLDRLGIPLIEITTAADIKTPQQARDVAEQIGLLLRSTGKVKKGLGTIRQDLNVSVAGGARVEIKGVQSLSSITRVAQNEALRQLGLIEIYKILRQRVTPKDFNTIEHKDLTTVFKDSKSNIIRKQIDDNGCVKGIILPGFNGLLKRPETRVGKELSVYAKLSTGIGGILHSDELPAYGVTDKEVSLIRTLLHLQKNDAFVLAIGIESMVDNALDAVVERAVMFLDGGVPEEVRRSLPDDTTEYMRPLPGSARMYPETDVPPLRVSSDDLHRIKEHLPEHPSEKQKRFIKEYQLHDEQIKQLLESGYEHDFERLVKEFPLLKNTIIRTFLNTFPELEHEGTPTDTIDEQVLSLVFSALSKDQFAKEAVPQVLKYLIQHQNISLNDAVTQCGLQSTDQDAIVQCIRTIVSDRKEFIKKRGKTESLGPLMGVVMKELRGKVDGKVISTILEQEIDKII